MCGNERLNELKTSGKKKRPKGSINPEMCNEMMTFSNFSSVISQKQKKKAATAMKREAFLFIPVGLFRGSLLGIQGHRY